MGEWLDGQVGFVGVLIGVGGLVVLVGWTDGQIPPGNQPMRFTISRKL